MMAKEQRGLELCNLPIEEDDTEDVDEVEEQDDEELLRAEADASGAADGAFAPVDGTKYRAARRKVESSHRLRRVTGEAWTERYQEGAQAPYYFNEDTLASQLLSNY